MCISQMCYSYLTYIVWYFDLLFFKFYIFTCVLYIKCEFSVTLLQARRWQIFYGTIFELMTGRQADLIAQVLRCHQTEWRLAHNK